MTFDEAKSIAIAMDADMRHPGLVKGLVIKVVKGELNTVNPISNRWGPFTPTEDDLTRTDWTVGQGLAAL